MTETRLLLLRHGRQSDTRCNVDVGLSREGERQADLAGERMRSWDISSLWASGMLRARETAARVNNHLGLPRVDVDPTLREIDFGQLEGLYDTEIAEQFADFQAGRAGRTTISTIPAARIPRRSWNVCSTLWSASPEPLPVRF